MYLVTNPYYNQGNDPSPTAFGNMYDPDKSLTSTALASAVNGFAINYLESTYLTSFQAIDMIDRTETTKNLVVSFDKPVYSNG